MITELLDYTKKALSDEQAAGVALALADQITQMTAALEELKTQLRAVAEQARGSESVVLIRGVDSESVMVGDVTVTFPRPQGVLSKSFNPTKVRALLGDAVFDLYFEQKVALRKGVLDTLRERKEDASLPETEFEVVFSSIDITEQTPRVGFRPISQGLLVARYR